MKLSVVFVLFNVKTDAMGTGLIVSVMPDLIQEVRGADIGSAALWSGPLSTVLALMQFLFGPVIGAL